MRMYAKPSVILTVFCVVGLLFLPDQCEAVKLERNWKTLPLQDVNASVVLSGAGMPFYRIINKIDRSVYIGANETLIELSLSGNSVTDKQITLVTEEPPALVSCDVKNPTTYETVCWNFIRVVEKTNSGNLFVCGTNSYSGICYLCPEDFNGGCEYVALMTPSKAMTMVPEAPTTNPSTAVFNRTDSEKVLYSTSSAQEFLERYLIPNKKADPFQFELGTVTTKKRLLNRPDFVGKPFEYTDSNGRNYVFIFYREIALEYSTFGGRVYPRIARVCQNDTGGVVNVDKFVTYVKARLNCSIPDSLMPFYFDEIQDVVWNSQEEVVYAIFTSQSIGPKSSALCRYRMIDIMKLFDEGDSKDQAGGEAKNEWLPQTVRDPTPGTCNEVHTTTYPPLMDKLVPNHNLMEPTTGNQVSPPSNFPMSDPPTLYVNGVRFTSMAIDMDNSVYFFGTSNGTIIKHYNGLTVEINELGTTGAITGLELLEDNSIKHLVITTDNNVITWALNNYCSARSQQECEILRSPYCQWTDGACNCLTSNTHCSGDANLNEKVLVQPTADEITSCGNTDIFLNCEADGGSLFNGAYNLTWLKDGDEAFIGSNSHLVEVTHLSDKLVELRVAVHKKTEGTYTCKAMLDNISYTKDVQVIQKSCVTQTSLDNRCAEYKDLQAERQKIGEGDACSVDVKECSQCRLGYNTIPGI